ncbi:MAG TPA: hypothetical protein VMA83_06710 [Solirubrobacteraceae bacterium]|nr:hypothetical protein [Solirubrobacteraceae bacterium]
MPTARSSARALAALIAALSLLCAAAPQAFAGVSLGGNNLAEEAESESSSSSSSSGTSNGEGKETKETSSSTTNSTFVLGIGVAVVLLMGIGFIIVRDARRRAPVSDAAVDAAVHQSHIDHQAQLRRRRARAKAARQQRKRNR